MREYVAKKWVMLSGERYCALVRRVTSLPHFYSTVYITTQIRDSSLSLSAMEYDAVRSNASYGSNVSASRTAARGRLCHLRKFCLGAHGASAKDGAAWTAAAPNALSNSRLDWEPGAFCGHSRNQMPISLHT